MKRLWITAVLLLAAAGAGCNRWDEYPYPPAYYQPYYQQPYYSQPSPGYQPSGTTYAQPATNPCSPAAIKQ